MKKNKLKGYSALELMVILGVVSLMLYLSVNFNNSLLNKTPGQVTAQQAYNYSHAVQRYITTHYNLLQELLTEGDGKGNNRVATVSTEILMSEGFIKNDLYYQNKLHQYPCTIIYWENNQLQAFIYYRTNGDDKKLDQAQINSGLHHVGAMLGLYKDGEVDGSAKDWHLDKGFTTTKFVAQGTADLSQGTDPAKYYCKGTQIANNSYVVNVTSQLMLNNRLAKDDTIHQYPDVLHEVDDPNNNNRMNTDLNMDYVDEHGNRTQSNIIFQMNPDCQMNPKDPETMFDYAPQTDDKTGANPRGCRNRQLAIQAGTDSNGVTLTVTGFKQAGNLKDNTVPHPYVGEISAASIQPTREVQVGTGCSVGELGKMAKQARAADPNDVNNIYVSQVVCMVNPLCPKDTDGYCYTAVNSVTIQIKPNHQQEYTCPAGMGMINYEENHEVAPNWGADCCQWTTELGLSICWAYTRANDHVWDGTSFSYLSGIASAYPIKSGVRTGLIHYGYTCDAACTCPAGYAGSWQPSITSITCSNDPSKVPIVVKVPNR